MSDRKAKEIEIEEGIGIEEVPEDGFEVEEVVQGEFIGLPEDEAEEDVMPEETDEVVNHDE